MDGQWAKIANVPESRDLVNALSAALLLVVGTYKRVVTVVVVAVVLGGVLLGCGGPDVSRYQGLLDKMAIPPAWQLVHTTIQRPGGPDHEVSASRLTDDTDCSRLALSCPAVIRSYLAPGTPSELLPVAQKMFADAGYSIDEVIRPDCDGGSSGACVLVSIQGTDRIAIHFYDPGDDLQGLGVARPDHSILVLSAEPKK
jgi:hypothetical protein